jgi:hypothetical protein
MPFIEIHRVTHPAPPLVLSTVPRKIGYICWGCAVLLSVIAAIMAYGQYQKLSRWQPVDATVKSNEVYSDFTKTANGNRVVVFGARFTMVYTVDGHDQAGVADLGFRSGFRSLIEHQAKLLPAGSHRQVRVNPDDPTELSLASDFGQLSFASAYFVFTLAMSLFAVGLLFWWWGVILIESRQKRNLFAVAR